MNIVKIGIAWFRVYLRRTRNGCREREREREREERKREWGLGSFPAILVSRAGHGRSKQEKEKVSFLELKDIPIGPLEKPFFFV